MTLKETDLEELIYNVQNNINYKKSFHEIYLRFNKYILKIACQPYLFSIKEDVICEGYYALSYAIKTYNKNYNVKPQGYIVSCIKYTIWNFYNKNKKIKSRELLPEFKTDKIFIRDSESNSEHDFFDNIHSIKNSKQTCLSDDVNMILIKNMIDIEIPKLTKKQQLVIKDFFFNNLTLVEIGKKRGVSPQSIFNIKKKGLKMLKEIFEQKYNYKKIEDFCI